MDDEFERATRAMKPQSGRPFMTAVVLNSLLAIVLLGIPYLRGRARASEAVERYATFAACIFDGERTPEPGLGMPPGYEDRYAEHFARAPAAWPSRCDAALDALEPDEAIFIMPGAKNAEATLRAAIELTHSELGAMARTRGSAAPSVPERPLMALDRLRGAVAEVLTASDLEVDDTAAIALREGTPASPSRVPLGTGSGGPFAARPERGGMRALGVDGRRVASVSTEEGRVREYHARRPPSTRGALLCALGPYLVTTTSEASCAQDESRCARRLTGLTPFGEADASGPLSPRQWIGAHPAGRVDRALILEPTLARVAARAPDGRGVELRAFSVPPLEPRPEGDAPLAPDDAAPGDEEGDDPAPDDEAGDEPRAVEPLELRGSIELGVVRDILVFERGARWVFVSEGQTFAGFATADGTRIPDVLLPELGQHLALTACEGWTLVAGSEGLAVVTPDQVALPRVELPLRTPLVGPSAEQDGFAIACGDETADVFVTTRSGALVHTHCDAEACAEASEVTARAASVSAGHARGVSVVAYHGGGAAPQIYVRRVRDGQLGPVEAPSPCWERGAGLCGAPTLASDGETLLLIAHERGDLLVMSLRDEGWAPLPGLP